MTINTSNKRGHLEPPQNHSENTSATLSGKNDSKELKKTAMLDTAHYCGKYSCKSTKHSTWQITVQAPYIVTTEQLQHNIPQNHGLFQVHNCKYPA